MDHSFPEPLSPTGPSPPHGRPQLAFALPGLRRGRHPFLLLAAAIASLLKLLQGSGMVSIVSDDESSLH